MSIIKIKVVNRLVINNFDFEGIFLYKFAYFVFMIFTIETYFVLLKITARDVV